MQGQRLNKRIGEQFARRRVCGGIIKQCQTDVLNQRIVLSINFLEFKVRRKWFSTAVRATKSGSKEKPIFSSETSQRALIAWPAGVMQTLPLSLRVTTRRPLAEIFSVTS